MLSRRLGALGLVALALAARAPAQDAAPPARQGGGADPSKDAFDLGSPAALPPGTTEEAMWPAATAEGWKKPCLVHWQRSFADAKRVARARNQPILVAVNMDGEIASEHFAGVRYRDPETAALLARYVCVVASVYRHTTRDYDEKGRRVECPRFGTVTCGEHIEAERELYDLYFDGRRVSPRHLVLDLEGRETYDVYYSWDTATVVTTFRKGVEGWPEPEPPGERTLVDLLASSDVDDRRRVERAYFEGDVATKRVLLESLVKEPVVDQVEVLRAAIFGFDRELARLARRALARCETEGALDLMAEALQVPLEASERGLLLDAVARLAETSPRARTLAALHGGLAVESRRIDVEALAREYDAASVRRVDVDARARAAEAAPREPGALLALARALATRAEEATEPRYARLFWEDARANARRAEEAGARGPELDAVVALAAAELGEPDLARARAVAAVEGGLLRLGAGAGAEGGEAEGALTPASKARLLGLFADARRRAIRAAFRAGERWPPEWLTDASAAFDALALDPGLEAAALIEHHDFLRWLGATARANAVLDDALRRYPDSPELHERLRARLLWEGGPDGLERGYAERVARSTAPEGGQLTWFAGYASLVAAEHHRRRNELDAALAAYERAAASYRRNAELFPDGRDRCEHFLALGEAGRARVALERGELVAATTLLLGALELRPASAATPDGLGIAPIATAKMLHARLVDAGDAERAGEVQAALDALDPGLLEPPPSERGGSGRRGRPARRER